jgi:putative flippase GtrA
VGAPLSLATLRRAASFIVAGTVGFLVDSLVLQLLAEVLGLQVHAARVISFVAAVTATWLVNRMYTFRRESQGGLIAEWCRYFLSSLGGGAVNYAAFALALAFIPYVREHLYVGVAIGSLAGMLVNYTLYSRFVFRRPAGTSPPT